MIHHGPDHHHFGSGQWGSHGRRRRPFGGRHFGYRSNNWGPPVPGTAGTTGRTILILVLVAGTLLVLGVCLLFLFAMFR
ncbi:MAG: hypothetical protein L0G99_06295 [Propionibacteriales bacterium]|nr:hypothetical protein [Propionibacteriales bacterium]